MAKKDTHLTQTGAEVQAILNEAQRVYIGLPNEIVQTDEGDICIVPAHDDVDAEAFEYRNGAWVSRADIDRALAKANTAYQKPATGIPASDIADGVIPDVSNFITKTVDDLVNYYLKSEIYTKSEVEALIGAIQHFHYEVYASTGAVTNPQSNVLYLIGPTGSGSDRYEEYVYTNNTWTKIGDTSIDLSDYVTTTALNTALANYTTTDNLNTLLAGKQDVINDLAAIRSGAAAGATAYQKPNTGIPASDLADGVIPTVPTDVVKYTSQSLTDAQKGQARTNIGAGTYSKPSGGIPKTDLASGVQSSLDLADSAVQATPVGQVTPEVNPYDYATREELNQLGQKVTTRATSVNDASYAVRATTGSSSLTDNPSGTRLRIVFSVKTGDTIRLASTFPSGYSCGIWDTPAHCVQASSSTGVLQTLVNGYTTEPGEWTSLVDGYLGVSFSNDTTAISDDLKATMLASLTVFVGGNIPAQLNTMQKEIDTNEGAIEKLSGDVYAEPLVYNTTTNALTPSSYVSKTGGPLEDTAQVLPAGAKLTKVKMYSTGSQNSNGKTSLYIYDSSRALVKTIELDKIGATDTVFDISDKNIIIQEGYHYAFDRMGYKYDTSIPNGRFKVASSGNNADTKSWFGWTFTYEFEQTKLQELVADYPELFDRKVTVNNPLPSATYESYNNGSAVEDKWQNLPVGAKLTKVHCSSKGTAGSNFTFLHIYDNTRTQVGDRIQLGQIGTTDTTFDISAQNIVVQEGYHYCVQYVAQVVIATNNTNSGRYYCPGNDTSPFSGYQLGFSFSYETTRDKVVESPMTGKYAAFIGDSICQGAGFQGGYPLLLAKNYGMLPPQNLGASGGIVATDTNESRVYINAMVSKMDVNADFFIAEGGINDADLNVPLGELSEGFTAELDDTTFYGAMETMCKALITTFAGKKVGYIFVHRVSLTTKYAYDYTGDNNYYVAAKECCEKWGIPFLDLNKHCPPLGCIASLKSSYTKDGDGYHPNEAGYNKYYVDRIAAWMQTL